MAAWISPSAPVCIERGGTNFVILRMSLLKAYGFFTGRVRLDDGRWIEVREPDRLFGSAEAVENEMPDKGTSKKLTKVGGETPATSAESETKPFVASDESKSKAKKTPHIRGHLLDRGDRL